VGNLQPVHVLIAAVRKHAAGLVRHDDLDIGGDHRAQAEAQRWRELADNAEKAISGLPA
jgi:hypothetical protein